MKFGNLNFLEPSGPLQACNGTALPLPLPLPLPEPQFRTDTSWTTVLMNDVRVRCFRRLLTAKYVRFARRYYCKLCYQLPSLLLYVGQHVAPLFHKSVRL
jgi:hypothetical protein